MGFKNLSLIFFALLFCHSCVAYEFKKSDELTLFKNYALSSCVASYYKSESIYQDALDALSGSREYGNISLDAYHEVNKELAKWSQKKYMSKSKNESEFFKCIDFQNSKEVEAIFSRYDPCQYKEQWLDEKKYEIKCKTKK